MKLISVSQNMKLHVLIIILLETCSIRHFIQHSKYLFLNSAKLWNEIGGNLV